MNRDRKALLKAAFAKGRLLLVGIDPPEDLEGLPDDVKVYDGGELNVVETLFGFGKTIIDAAAPVAVAVKPNIAFFEQHGPEGLQALKRLVLYAHRQYPELLVIVDSKRNDIGKTAEAYARSLFRDGKKGYDFDGTTVNGSLGWDGIKPFAEYEGGSRLVFVLCHTSNKSAAVPQEVPVDLGDEQFRAIAGDLNFGADRMLYYEMTAHLIGKQYNGFGNVGAVVGATYPEQMAAIRAILPNAVFVVPGFGTQGGDEMSILEVGLTEEGGGLLCNYSSGISEAYKKDEFAGMSFAESVAAAIAKFDAKLRACRREVLAFRIFERTKAVLHGHYVYKSKRHGDVFVAKEKALEDVEDVRDLAGLLAEMLAEQPCEFDIVIGPADPGTMLAERVAEAYFDLTGNKVGWGYAGKDGENYVLKTDVAEKVQGKRVAMVDDIITKGTTYFLVKSAISTAGGQVVVFAAMWNRGGLSSEEADALVRSLVNRRFPDYAPEECAKCAQGIRANEDHGHGKEFNAQKDVA